MEVPCGSSFSCLTNIYGLPYLCSRKEYDCLKCLWRRSDRHPNSEEKDREEAAWPQQWAAQCVTGIPSDIRISGKDSPTAKSWSMSKKYPSDVCDKLAFSKPLSSFVKTRGWIQGQCSLLCLWIIGRVLNPLLPGTYADPKNNVQDRSQGFV